MPRPKKEVPKTVTVSRKVFFYRIDAGVSQDTGEPLLINFSPGMKHLDKMPFSEAGRYLKPSDGKELCCWPDSLKNPFRLRLANIRRGQHPPIEKGGAFTPLVLGAGRGLAEITHFVLFPDGICGAEFNFHGPRASQLAFYCAMKLGGVIPPFRLASLVRPDLNARLAQISDVRLMTLKTRASFAETLESADEDLGAALQANIRAFRARPEDEFEIRFVRRKNKKLSAQTSPATLMRAVRKLGGRSDLKEQVSIFKLQGQGDGSRLVDILHEQFTAEKEIKPSLDSIGAVDTESMFSAIEEAYANMKEELSRARDLE